jgi:hypothetical protein
LCPVKRKEKREREREKEDEEEKVIQLATSQSA